MNQRLLSVFVLSAFIMVASPVHAVFIGDSGGFLYDYDTASNSSTLLGYSGVGAMYDIALNPVDNILYGVTGNKNLYTLDKTSGVASLVGSTGHFINGLTFDSSGMLYGSGGSWLYTIDLSGATATEVGTTGFSSSGDLAFDSSGNLFMSALRAVGSSSDQLVSIDTVSGGGTRIGDIGFTGVYGLNFADSVLYGFTSLGSTITIDMTTGDGTFFADNSILAYGADGGGGVAPVPEPASMLLFGTGIIGFAGLQLRRKKR